ncbi:MAG: GIY-YIG nuclease family protein [Terriglobia bacterium]
MVRQNGAANKIVTHYARMWPREVLYLKDERLLEQVKKALAHPGVYILYWDDQPYYIGQAVKKGLYHRIRSHGTKSNRSYYNFWNFFSAFVVPDKNHIAEVEAVLIASGRTVNRAVPKINPIRLPPGVSKLLSKRWEIAEEPSAQ